MRTNLNFYDIAYQGFLWAAGPLDERGVGGLRGPRCRPGVNGGRLGGGLEPVHEAEVDELPVDEDVAGLLVGLAVGLSLVVEVHVGQATLLEVA